MRTLARIDPGHLARVREAFTFGGGFVAWNDVFFTITHNEMRVVLRGNLYGPAFVIDVGIPVGNAQNVQTINIPPTRFGQILAGSGVATNAVVCTGDALDASTIMFASVPS